MDKIKRFFPLCLVLLSPAAVASELINVSPEAYRFDVSLGMLKGESRELVYDTWDNSKISELIWKINNTAILKGGMTWDLHQYISFNANGWTTLSSGSSHMEDYDWMTPGQEKWSHQSTHPKTHLNYANQYDVNLTGWLIHHPDYRLGVVAGYQQTAFSWLAKGGDYNYDNGNDIGSFPDGERGIGYKQKFKLPYLELSGSYRYKDIDVTALLKYSPWVKASDNDEHYMRQLTFTEKGKNADYFSASLSAGDYVTPNTRLFTEFSWTRFAEAKATTNIYHHPTGDSLFIDGDAAGIKNYNYTYSAGVQYQF